VIKTATIIPAKAMGLDTDTGTLEIGKEADIAILDKNPLLNISHLRTVSAVITNGNYYESEPLWLAADFKSNKKIIALLTITEKLLIDKSYYYQLP